MLYINHTNTHPPNFQAPDFYAFADRLTASSGKWEGEVLAWAPQGGKDVQSWGTCVSSTCGGLCVAICVFYIERET